MIPLLAAYADKVILDAAERFLPIAIVALAFGFVYWLIRRSAAKREKARLEAWLKERREKRESENSTPSDR